MFTLTGQEGLGDEQGGLGEKNRVADLFSFCDKSHVSLVRVDHVFDDGVLGEVRQINEVYPIVAAEAERGRELRDEDSPESLTSFSHRNRSTAWDSLPVCLLAL